MRPIHAAMSMPWRKMTASGFLVLAGLFVTSLSQSQAQMYYSGGFRPAHLHPPRFPVQQQPQPASPQPPSYFPDSDTAYPNFSGGATRRPLPTASDLGPYRVLPSDLPWNRADFVDYSEAVSLPRDSELRQPTKYVLTATPVGPVSPEEGLEKAMLIARLPDHAVLWVEGIRTLSMGRTRYFLSPQLLPGRPYNYRVSVAWIEDGRWVGQSRMVPVQAGSVQAIYLRPTPKMPAKLSLPE